MKMKNFIIGMCLAGAMWMPATMSFGAARQWGSVETYQFLKTPKIDTNGTIIFSIKETAEADIAADGLNLITGDSYQINNTSVLNATTLGSGVTSSSLTSFGSSSSFGTDTLTTDSADPGTATATLAAGITYVISDATGAGEDQITVPDGTVAGQIKKFVLYIDAETTGVAIAPTTTTMVGGAGTSTLLEDAGDSVTFIWSGSTLGWTLQSWIGATVE